MKAMTTKLIKDGDARLIILPDEILENVGIMTTDDMVNVEIASTAIMIKPVKLLDRLFANYNSRNPYPYEVVDKGGAIGKEI